MSIAIFFILNLINVILGTMRSILTVKSTPTVAMIINTVSYTFYAGIVKMTSGQPMWIVLTATAVTNIIGVYLAKWIVDKFTKDRLWLVKITIPYADFEMAKLALEVAKIPNTFYNLHKYYVFDCYCENQEQATKVLKVCKKCGGKAFAIENKL